MVFVVALRRRWVQASVALSLLVWLLGAATPSGKGPPSARLLTPPLRPAGGVEVRAVTAPGTLVAAARPPGRPGIRRHASYKDIAAPLGAGSLVANVTAQAAGRTLTVATLGGTARFVCTLVVQARGRPHVDILTARLVVMVSGDASAERGRRLDEPPVNDPASSDVEQPEAAPCALKLVGDVLVCGEDAALRPFPAESAQCPARRRSRSRDAGEEAGHTKRRAGPRLVRTQAPLDVAGVRGVLWRPVCGGSGFHALDAADSADAMPVEDHDPIPPVVAAKAPGLLHLEEAGLLCSWPPGWNSLRNSLRFARASRCVEASRALALALADEPDDHMSLVQRRGKGSSQNTPAPSKAAKPPRQWRSELLRGLPVGSAPVNISGAADELPAAPAVLGAAPPGAAPVEAAPERTDGHLAAPAALPFTSQSAPVNTGTCRSRASRCRSCGALVGQPGDACGCPTLLGAGAARDAEVCVASTGCSGGAAASSSQPFVSSHGSQVDEVVLSSDSEDSLMLELAANLAGPGNYFDDAGLDAARLRRGQAPAPAPLPAALPSVGVGSAG